MHQRLLPLSITIDGQPTAAATFIADQGPPWVLTITTSLPRHALEVSSTYIGRRGTPTHIVHLVITPGTARSFTEERPAGTLPLTHARELLLYDHLAALQAHAADRAGTLAAEVDERTTAAVALTI